MNLLPPMLVRMLCQNTGQSRRSDRLRALYAQPLKVIGDFISITRDQNLCVRFEKLRDSFPLVRDQAGACAGSFEHTSRWTEPVPRHAIAADVQHGARRAVERVVLACADMTDVPHIRRYAFVAPA